MSNKFAEAKASRHIQFLLPRPYCRGNGIVFLMCFARLYVINCICAERSATGSNAKDI